MCINTYENLSDQEKIDLLKDYVDYKYSNVCYNYDEIRKIENNNVLKRKFLKACVPVWYDQLTYYKVFQDNLALIDVITDNMEKLAFEYPTFYLMACICGALDCYWESLSLKKVLWRGSTILLRL